MVDFLYFSPEGDFSPPEGIRLFPRRGKRLPRLEGDEFFPKGFSSYAGEQFLKMVEWRGIESKHSEYRIYFEPILIEKGIPFGDKTTSIELATPFNHRSVMEMVGPKEFKFDS